jgi:hypothetical protein
LYGRGLSKIAHSEGAPTRTVNRDRERSMNRNTLRGLFIDDESDEFHGRPPGCHKRHLGE